MTRLTRYIAKKVKITTKPKTTTKPKKRIKKLTNVRKAIKITAKDIEHEKRLSGYTGKITPYIKKRLIKRAKARKQS